MQRCVKLSRLLSAEKLRVRMEELGIDLPLAGEGEGAEALGEPWSVGGRRIGNRFAALPMEGWDGTPDGRPTPLVERRWRRFGQSGAKLVWGGEAFAVRADGRANPKQLCLGPRSEGDLLGLRAALVDAHAEAGLATHDLLVGLQLTHSGRFSRPQGAPAPRTALRHEVLDARVGIRDASALLSDLELDELIGDYARAAALAARAGFDFVDVKACHGYLIHELLSARTRAGAYGGDLEGRARFLLRAIEAVRAAAPSLLIGVRLSIFDLHPFARGEDGLGQAETSAHHPFGGDRSGLAPDLRETSALVTMLERAGVVMICTTAGSPYYNPHIQRPALHPPSDGYAPPEDPLVGVERQIRATAALRRSQPGIRFVGSGYTYLQEWLPRVAEAVVRTGMSDAIGLGRMMLSYPELPADVLAGREPDQARICRTFSDCTTAPRNGLVSGCYPLDPEYKRRAEATMLAEIKKRLRRPDPA